MKLRHSSQRGTALSPRRAHSAARALGVLMCLLALATAGSAQSISQTPGPRGLPPALRDVDFNPQLNAALPLDLPFRDETGRAVQLREYFHGKPVVLAFVYYGCPMLCNQIRISVVGVLKMIAFSAGKEYDVVFVSFDPRETPAMAAAKKKETLERYARPESAAGWHFLTGDQPSIAALTRAANFRYTFDAQKNLFAHASGVLVLTPEGRISRYFFGIDYPPRDMRLGLVEASAGKIGTPIDRVLLFCYEYDPASGRYSTVILRLVRAGGILMVLMIVAGILIFRRRESHARHWKSQGAS
jgi:protein SCO1/2